MTDEFSHEIRKLVSASRGVLKTDDVGALEHDEVESMDEAVEDLPVEPREVAEQAADNGSKPEQAGGESETAPNIAPSLTNIPLDRRRSVPLADMDDDELHRAHEQARKRVDRTGVSPDRTRYEQHLSAAHTEIVRRAAPPEQPDPVVEVPQPDPEGDPGPDRRPGAGLQTNFPTDTPESDHLQ